MSSTQQQKPTRGGNPRGKLKGAKPNTCEAKQPTPQRSTRKQNVEKQREQHVQVWGYGCHQLRKGKNTRKMFKKQCKTQKWVSLN